MTDFSGKVFSKSGLTRLDNDYTVLASELQVLKDRPVPTSAPASAPASFSQQDSGVLSDLINQVFVTNKIALIERKVDQMNITLSQLKLPEDDPMESVYATKSWVQEKMKDIPDDVIGKEYLNQTIEAPGFWSGAGDPLGAAAISSVSDVIIAKMGGKTKLAAAMINASATVKTAAVNQTGNVLGKVVDGGAKVIGDVLDFGGDLAKGAGDFLVVYSVVVMMMMMVLM